MRHTEAKRPHIQYTLTVLGRECDMSHRYLSLLSQLCDLLISYQTT